MVRLARSFLQLLNTCRGLLGQSTRGLLVFSDIDEWLYDSQSTRPSCLFPTSLSSLLFSLRLVKFYVS
jgi:hypothetical protein